MPSLMLLLHDDQETSIDIPIFSAILSESYFRALLMSEEFQATDKISSGPLCLKFWTHMYGNGVGSLNVYVREESSGNKRIWGLTGDAGNNWYMGQAPISSTQSFRVTTILFFHFILLSVL